MPKQRREEPTVSPSKVLLCIDDNEEGLAIRKLFLEAYGYSVLTASSGKAGLDLLAAQPVDAIILDYRLPGMTGAEIAREARRIKPEVPILMLSGYPSVVPREVRDHADAFLVKGRPPSELLSEIERLVGARPRQGPTSEWTSRTMRAWETAVGQAEERIRRRRRRRQRRHEEELHQAEETLQATERLALAGRLSASIAHEISNPLESVSNLLYLLEKEATFTELGRHYLEVAHDELARVVGIARQTLDLHRETAEPVAIRVPELMQGLFELYDPRLKERNIQVTTRYAQDADVYGFPGELRQVFSNLLLNAVEAAGDHGRICFLVSNSRDWRRPGQHGVRVTVIDNGPGIAPRHRRHLFQPFFTTKGEKGTGLGLWLSSRIVQKHGGHIRLRTSTRPGRSGSAFQVFLPRRPKAADSDNGERMKAA